MRLVSTQDIQGNEVLAKHIIDETGRILLSKGVRLKLSYLNKLSDLGISSIYIEDEISEGIEIADVIQEETRLKAKNVVRNEMNRLQKSKEINLSAMEKVTSSIIEDILSRESLLMNLSDIKTKDDYTFSHSVNVCVLSVMLALKLNLDVDRVKSIATGCILHDFGKILIPVEIINKPSRLTEEEYNEIKKHPLYGYEALRDDFNIRPITKVVVLMHHERINGTGYPHGLYGDKIHQSAKIGSICDVYDAMTSDRIYRKARTASNAVAYLYSTAGILFERDLVVEFLKNIPLYPVGTVVLLNTGIVGIVVKNNPNNLMRPVVRLLYNSKSRIRYKNYEVDLMEDFTLTIEREFEFDMNEYKGMSSQ